MKTDFYSVSLQIVFLLCLLSTASFIEAVSYREYRFQYYTRANGAQAVHSIALDENDKIQIPTALANAGQRPSFLYIHGYFSIPLVQQRQVDMYFKNKGDADTCCHFFILDWTAGACWTEYHFAIGRTPVVCFISLMCIIDSR